MRWWHWPTAVLPLGVLVSSAAAAAQLLPPPRDTEIRTVYWELRNESEVWLTLEPRTPKGEPAPLLTFTYTFRGKTPSQSVTDIEVRAYAGTMAASRTDLVFVLDEDERIDVSPNVMTSGTPFDYASGRMPVDTLRAMATAHRITGRLLGVAFELSEQQRKALVSFSERAASAGRR
jgi:hypothetical protein